MYKITDLEEGKIIHIFPSHELHVLLLVDQGEDAGLYHIRADKTAVIKTVEKVVVKDNLSTEDLRYVRIFKTREDGDYIKFLGSIELNHGTFKCHIEDGELNVEDEEYVSTSKPVDPARIENVDVIKIIKKNNYYVLGYETFDDALVFGVFVPNRGFKKIYYLFSDLGELEVASLAVDFTEGIVYLGGRVKTDTEAFPYLEMMLV